MAMVSLGAWIMYGRADGQKQHCYYRRRNVNRSSCRAVIMLLISTSPASSILTLCDQHDRFRLPHSRQIRGHARVRPVVFRVHVTNDQIAAVFDEPSEISRLLETDRIRARPVKKQKNITPIHFHRIRAIRVSVINFT